MNRHIRRILSILMMLVVMIGLIGNFNIEVNANGLDIVDINKGTQFTAQNLNEMGAQLALRYPELIKYELLGYSFDKRPIHALIMTTDISKVEKIEDLYTDKMHYLVVAGTHSREDVNPVMALNMIEEYAKAYYGNGYYGDYNIKEVLNRAVLHFIPTTNPDGFDLVRQGYSAAQTEEAKQSLNNIESKNYSNFKANMRGVDLNRNFPTIYLDKETGELKDYWDIARVSNMNLYSSKPHMEFFAGFSSGSETETQIVMKYMERYDFRNLMSLHSRGEVLYWNKPSMPVEYKERAYRFVNVLQNVTGYKIVGHSRNPESELSGSGYESDYVATQINKPFVTVETLPAGLKLPAAQKYYAPTYERVKYLPLAAEQEGYSVGYLPYRLYVNGEYIRDFGSKDYVEAHAKAKGGIVLEGSGKPLASLGEFITRADFIEQLVDAHIVFVKEGSHIKALKSSGVIKTVLKEANKSGFDDYTSNATNFAYKSNIIRGDENGNFRPFDYITPTEASVIVYKLAQVIVTEYKEANKEEVVKVEEVEEVEILEEEKLTEDYKKKLINELILQDKPIPEWAREAVIEVIKEGYFVPESYDKGSKYLDMKMFNKDKWGSLTTDID